MFALGRPRATAGRLHSGSEHWRQEGGDDPGPSASCIGDGLWLLGLLRRPDRRQDPLPRLRRLGLGPRLGRPDRPGGVGAWVLDGPHRTAASRPADAGRPLDALFPADAPVGALGGGSAAHGARFPRWRTTRWPNLIPLTSRNVQRRSSLSFDQGQLRKAQRRRNGRPLQREPFALAAVRRRQAQRPSKTSASKCSNALKVQRLKHCKQRLAGNSTACAASCLGP